MAKTAETYHIFQVLICSWLVLSKVYRKLGLSEASSANHTEPFLPDDHVIVAVLDDQKFGGIIPLVLS